MTLTVIAYVVAAAALFWVGMVTFFLGGLIFVILAAILAGLKLAGIFVWSWWWTALPLFGAVGGAVVKTRICSRSRRQWYAAAGKVTGLRLAGGTVLAKPPARGV